MIALFLILAAQDGEVDRLLAGHEQKLRAARLPGEQRRVIEETRTKLEAFAAQHPKHPDVPRALWHAAEGFLAVGDRDTAIARLAALVKAHPEAAPASNARFALGELHLEKEEWAKAQEAFAEFLQRHPQDERAFYAKALTATALQGAGDYDKAVQLLRGLREEYKTRPESWGALLQAAVALHAQEKNADARAVLDQVIQTCPDRELQDVARLHLAAYLKLGSERPAGDLAPAGKVCILYFFDSTLQPAVDEARALKKLRDGLNAPDLALAGISVDLQKKDLDLFTTQGKIDWPLHFDGKGYDGAAAKAYDVRRLPALWVIDRKGRLRFHNLAGADLRRATSGLLQER